MFLITYGSLSGVAHGLKLVYHYHTSTQRPMNSKYTGVWTNLKDSDSPAFNYNTSYTLATWPSLADLNQKLDNPVGPEWFRSNVMIATDSDQPFQEDDWTGRVKLGEKVVLKFGKPCNRCLDITVNPEDGSKDPTKDEVKWQ